MSHTNLIARICKEISKHKRTHIRIFSVELVCNNLQHLVICPVRQMMLCPLLQTVIEQIVILRPVHYRQGIIDLFRLDALQSRFTIFTDTNPIFRTIEAEPSVLIRFYFTLLNLELWLRLFIYRFWHQHLLMANLFTLALDYFQLALFCLFVFISLEKIA